MKSEAHYQTALIGWSLPSMDAMAQLNRPFVVVAPEGFDTLAKQHDIQFIPWDF